MIVDCVSDLHGHYPKLDGGDLLIIAGDLTASDSYDQYEKFMTWIEKQKYIKTILIAGNHDNKIQEGLDFDFPDLNIEYLEDSGTEFEGLKIFGSPWTKTFKGINSYCKAFTCDTEEELDSKFSLIPDDTDILITHSPSFGNFDYTIHKESVGSLSLWMKCLEIRPRLHICGHIHEAYGQAIHYNGIHLVNASHVNERYQPVNKPIRVIL